MVRDTLFTAEFTTNHMGNLNILLRMADKAKEAGCDYIKMQKKDVESFYSQEKLNSTYQSPYGRTYRDYRSIFEFSDEDHRRFDDKCRTLGIRWFVTAQDLTSLTGMLKFDLPMYKVASVNATNTDLLKGIRDAIPESKTLVISVAGRSLPEIEATLSLFPDHRIHLLHCVAEYPCKVENLRLGNIPILKRTFEDDRIRIGYSGHEEGILPSLAAIHLGAGMVERHFALSRHSFVHHIECSREPPEFAEMVRIARREESLAPYAERLPRSAFEALSGMTDMEKSFLKDHTYGTDYLRDGSAFQN